jgi:hypothetical protein
MEWNSQALDLAMLALAGSFTTESSLDPDFTAIAAAIH